jgi:steroid delta-isomerase-like uncharacterized protein
MLEANKALVRRFYAEVVNQGKVDLADELLDAGFVEQVRPGTLGVGLENFKAFVRQLAVAFPDLQVSVEDLVAEGDRVVARVNVSGTHQGEFMGRVPATGRRVSFGGVDVFEIQDGKIRSRWNYRDILGLLQQLGAAP